MAAHPPITAPPAVTLSEARSFLRLRSPSDDAVISSMIAAATALCEQFTRTAIVARDISDVLPLSGDWQRLSQVPVRNIDAVYGLPADGGVVPLSADQYRTDIDTGGIGWVRIHAIGVANRIRVDYVAGLVADVADVPDAIRQGVLILAGHLHRARDDDSAGAPPAAVAALWQPWRRMRLA